MKFGANWLPTASPLALTKRPCEKIAPSAASTPGTARVFGSSLAEKAGGGPFSLLLLFVSRGVIVTSVPFSDSLKMSSNDALIVSVRTNAPAMKDTPRNTARVVMKARSLRETRPLTAMRRIRGLGHVLHQLDHLLGAPGGGVVHQSAVAQDDEAVGV